MDAIAIVVGSTLHLVVVFVAVLFFLSLSGKRKTIFAYRALLALPIAFLLGRLASLIILSPRPFVVENIQPLIAHVPNNGFPSEHMLLVSTISALIYTENRSLGLALGVLAILIGVARVWANVHHGIDIVGGAGIAVFSVMTSWYLVRWLHNSHASRLPFLRNS